MSSQEEARVAIDALLTQAVSYVADARNVNAHTHCGMAVHNNVTELL